MAVVAILGPIGTEVQGANLSPVSLRGSAAALHFQRTEAVRDQLVEISGERELAALVRDGSLVPLPQSRELRIDPSLKPAYRYVVPRTRQFLLDLAAEHYAAFGTPLQVNSACRTVTYQRRLRTRNANAAVRSSHVYGATVDLAKRNLSAREIAWLRDRLLQLERTGLVEATEEFRQLCFHVMVLKDYPASQLASASQR